MNTGKIMYESKITYRSDDLSKLEQLVIMSICTPEDLVILAYGHGGMTIYGHHFNADTKEIEDRINRVYELILSWKEYWLDV